MFRRTRPAAGKFLIVNADDFGADIAVNEASERAFTDGILTSASLMVGGAAAQDAIERARRLKGLGVGLHVTLADGKPILSRRRIPGLVDKSGQFRDDLVRSGMRWFFNGTVRKQLANEIDAQYQAFVKTGLVMDHVNAHKHLHIHPTAGKLIVGLGQGYGVPAIRIPMEPHKIIERVEPGRKAPRGPSLLLKSLRSRAANYRMMTNDQVFGLAWSGAMTEQRLLALIPQLPDGITELYMHPATKDAEAMPHAAAGYRYREELEALLSPRVKEAIAAADIKLTRYSALKRPQAPAAALARRA